MKLRQWKYYRSRATGKRILFSSEEIARVERDGWWAKVILSSGLEVKVTEIEPEAVLNEKPPKPKVVAGEDAKPIVCEHCGEQFTHAPDCITRLGIQNLNTESL